MNETKELMTELQLLRIEQVAEILNISRALAYRLARDGSLKAVHIGHAVRVHPADLQDYINTHSFAQDE